MNNLGFEDAEFRHISEGSRLFFMFSVSSILSLWRLRSAKLSPEMHGTLNQTDAQLTLTASRRVRAILSIPVCLYAYT